MIAVPSTQCHIRVIVDRIDDGLAINTPQGRLRKDLNVGIQLYVALARIRGKPYRLVDSIIGVFEIIPVVLALQVEPINSRTAA